MRQQYINGATNLFSKTGRNQRPQNSLKSAIQLIALLPIFAVEKNAI